MYKEEPQVNSWTKRGKKYQAKYLGALKELYGIDKDINHGKNANGRPGTDVISDLVNEKGNIILRNP